MIVEWIVGNGDVLRIEKDADAKRIEYISDMFFSRSVVRISEDSFHLIERTDIVMKSDEVKLIVFLSPPIRWSVITDIHKFPPSG